MEERSAFDILLDYPKERGLAYDTHHSTNRIYSSTADSLSSTKYVIFKMGSLYFYAFDSYLSRTFTGIYKPIDNIDDIEFNLYKKDWLDYIVLTNKMKTGIEHIDQYFTITSKSKVIPRNLNNEIISLFQKIYTEVHPIHMIITNNYTQVVSDFNGKKVIGLEANKWIYKKEELDIFIDTGSELIENIKIACM